MSSAATTAIPKVPKIPWWARLWEYVPSLIWGGFGLLVAVMAMRQSYHFGSNLAFSDFGKESMAQWLALIDVCTAALPIAAVIMGAKGHRRGAIALWLFTVLYVLFSMSSQVGFAAAERFNTIAVREAIPKAAKAAKEQQLALIKQQISWHNGTEAKAGTPAAKVTGKYTLEAYKMAAAATAETSKATIASIERLIDKAGAFDPKTVHAEVADPQAMALSKLLGGYFSEDRIAIWLSVLAAILVILAKPIFFALATHSWPGTSGPAAAVAAGAEAPGTGVPSAPVVSMEAPAVQPLTPVEASLVKPATPVAPVEVPQRPIDEPVEVSSVLAAVETPEVGASAPAAVEPPWLDIERPASSSGAVEAPQSNVADLIEAPDGIPALAPATPQILDRGERERRELRSIAEFFTYIADPDIGRWISATDAHVGYGRYAEARGLGTRSIPQPTFGHLVRKLRVQFRSRASGVEYYVAPRGGSVDQGLAA